MINRPHYIQHPLKFYESVVSRKHKKNRKLLAGIHTYVKSDFDAYIVNELGKNWHNHVPLMLSKKHSSALLGCYGYNVPEIVALRNAVMDKGRGIVDSVCPCCTIDSYSTMDHFLPKEAFPIHAVNPLNLIPCCQICNGHKGVKVKGENGERLFLNLYSDHLPREQYLFVKLSIEDGLPRVAFSVENRNGIDPALFGIIESHYEKLCLPERFAAASGNVLEELSITIRRRSARLTDEAIKEEIEADADEQKKAFGFNYWKAILWISCVREGAMYDFLKSYRWY